MADSSLPPQKRTVLSKRVAALVASGATAATILGVFLPEKEGRSLQAYQDGAHVWTICYGHTQGVKAGQRMTPEQCDAFLKSDIGQALAQTYSIAKVPMSEPQLAGITSFCTFNIGISKCRTSTMVRKLNAGDRVGACHEIPRWKYVDGKDCTLAENRKICGGIPDRRAAEEELCLSD
jgi:lysozyme